MAEDVIELVFLSVYRLIKFLLAPVVWLLNRSLANSLFNVIKHHNFQLTIAEAQEALRCRIAPMYRVDSGEQPRLKSSGEQHDFNIGFYQTSQTYFSGNIWMKVEPATEIYLIERIQLCFGNPGSRSRSSINTIVKDVDRMVLVFICDGLQLPHFRMTPIHIDPYISQYGWREIELNKASDFHDRYLVFSADSEESEQAVKALFTPQLIRLLPVTKPIQIAGMGDRLCIGATSKFFLPSENFMPAVFSALVRLLKYFGQTGAQRHHLAALLDTHLEQSRKLFEEFVAAAHKG